MQRLKGWQRVSELIDQRHLIDGKPDIATEINGYEVCQKQVGDCSVLSSLAVAAHYEFKHKWQKKLISWLIYPQDTKGNPIFNPTGKYVVKLFVNGAARGITVDDYFPVNQYGNFIGAYSNRGKLWVSLIEKAYLKLHGGYEFSGSKASRDLYILTRWLPETVNFDSSDFKSEEQWARI
jgi:calpain-7